MSRPKKKIFPHSCGSNSPFPEYFNNRQLKQKNFFWLTGFSITDSSNKFAKQFSFSSSVMSYAKKYENSLLWVKLLTVNFS